jgi:CheY-like chemotaxis protein
MKEEFVSVVSHELRTPLTAIRGSLGLISGGAVGQLPDDAARMVRIALDNSDRLTRLINDILDLERIESGAVPLELAMHDAAAILEAMFTTGLPLARAAGVVLVRGPVEGSVHGDADRIVQALTNLVGNAIKFSPQGGEVVVSAEREGAHVTFSVQDHGRGIPEVKLDSVFERFQQVDSSDAREKGGTGLGLAITKTIVERHGGRIWVDSKVGHGSSFRFTIPAATEPAPVPGLDQPHDAAPTVLLCDDDPDVLEILSRVLGQHGYAARPAARGREAVELAVASHPDAILVDLRMPGMTGWQAIAELKARPETREIPIIVMSGLGADTDPELAARTEGWLTKPVDEREMARLLLSALSSGGRQPTVLVVEDDDDLASVLVTMFERQGLAVVRAASETEAVLQVQRARPDVLVLDLYLLDGDGFGVVDQLRRDGRLGEVPVVVYSAHPLDAASRERLRLGEMVFLTKGHSTPDDLVRRVVAVVHSIARRDHHHRDVTTDGTTYERESAT